jgi:hypothetical protein
LKIVVQVTGNRYNKIGVSGRGEERQKRRDGSVIAPFFRAAQARRCTDVPETREKRVKK